ncbi:glycosyltransferase family 4 protein [Chryseobacterium sp. SNU WT5]|uniref:glycosyltransferase family 4 protein n=1 Tax=Chryseobacterium sp. SNU WT5 TaxID=2594269 RepID=UPI00117CD3CF|nr:glycosyltransferase family 4 protein [Chryseobacterium sp. SNU WT5]QDP85823.1 glycosyltransferase family 4 protein [Chryseobacterium sp. SNU WT5]
MNKKKICFIVSSPLTVKALLLENIKALSTEFEVYLVANFKNEEQINISPDLTDIFHVQIERKINLIKDLQALNKLRKVLKEQSFHAIHTVTPKAGLIGMLAGKIAKTKVRTHIFTGQVWYTKTGLMKALLMNLDRFLVSLSTNILVDGQSQRKFLISKKVITEHNSKVLGKGSISGVNINKFRPNINSRERYRAEQKYSQDEVVFLFLGRINRDKGVIELARAFSKLQQEIPHVKLLLIGFDEEKLVPQILSIVGDPNFKFYGSTNEPELLLQIGDVLCLPSHREGFGTTVIEGSLLGLPIICSDTYGLMETIIDDQTGFRHPVHDVESIYVQMKKLATDPQLRTKMGEAGRRYVLENFTAAQISGEWLQYYRDLLK